MKRCKSIINYHMYLTVEDKARKNDRVEVYRLKQLQYALFPQQAIQGFKQISFNF